MNKPKITLVMMAVLSGLLLTAQDAPRKGAQDFINYLIANQKTLQYKNFETFPKGAKIEIRVYCQEATQNQLLKAMSNFAAERYFIESSAAGAIVFTAVFPAAGSPAEAPAATRISGQEEPPAADAGALPQKSFRVGLTFGRFTVNDTNLSDFYHHGWANLPQIEASYHIQFNVDIWVAMTIYQHTATTSFYENESTFRLYPLRVGLLYRPAFEDLGKFEPFIGAGLNFYFYSETIADDPDLQGNSDSAVGFHLQAGTYYHILKWLDAKAFFRFNSVTKVLDDLLPSGDDEFDLGGIEYGIGFLVRF